MTLPVVTPLPTFDRGSPTFRADLDTYFLTNLPTTTNEINTACECVDGKAVAAATSSDESAASATLSDQHRLAARSFAQDAEAAVDAAAAIAGATMWEAVTTYSLGQCVWSPLNFQTYRRKVAGTSPDDPVYDTANWERVGGGGNSNSKSYYLGSM